MTTRHTTRKLPIAAVPAVTTVFWPEFFEYGGCVFVEASAPASLLRAYKKGERAEEFTGRTELEAKSNTLVLLEHFDESAWDAKRRTYRLSHADFKAAESVAKIIAQTWFAKLFFEFPDSDFRIYYMRRESPTITFHRIYDDESVWREEEIDSVAVRSGEIVILDTRDFRD